MAKQDLNIGAAPNDGTGDPLRDAMDKVNDNFNEIYTALGGNTVSNIVSGGVIDYTGSNKLTFLYTDISDLPAASSYHGMFAHAHNQGAAYFAHAGSWIELSNKSDVDALNINNLVDVDTASAAPTDGQVLAWSASNSRWQPAADAGGIALADLSITTASAGTAALAYNSNNGVFTYTPPDLSSYIALSDLSVGTEGTASGDGAIAYDNSTGTFTYTPPDLSGYQTIAGLATVATTGQYTDLLNAPTIPSVLTDLSISDGTAGQVLTTDGSGAFSFTTVSGGGGSYTDSNVDTHLNTSTATSGQILSWDGADYAWVADQSSGSGIALTDLSVTVASAGTANLTYDNSTGVFTYTPPDLSSLTSYADSDVDAHLNQSNPTSGHVLSWNGSDYAWVAQAGSSTDTLADITARGATTTDAVTISNTLTVDALDSTGLGFANLTSASDIVLNATGDINASSSKITNVLDPTAAQDAATKAYVDSAVLDNVPTMTVTAPNSGSYSFTGDGFPSADLNPTLTLYRGFTYHIVINSPGHPFWINSVNGTGQGNAYNDGVTNNGTTNTTISFTIPFNAPATLYYNCEYHSAMNGTINIP